MIRHLIKCEVCNTSFTFDPLARYPDAPARWSVLYPMKEQQAHQGWHFCSYPCLLSWVGEQMLKNSQVYRYDILDKAQNTTNEH